VTFGAERDKVLVSWTVPVPEINAPNPLLKPRYPNLWRMLQVEGFLVFIITLVWTMLAALSLSQPFLPMFLCGVVVGNVLIPLAWVSWRKIGELSPPWNWALFFPAQGLLSAICAFGTVSFLRFAGIDKVHSFWQIFHATGPLTIVVCMATGLILLVVGEVQRKLKERNQQLEQTVEKGTIALQEQEQELKRAREIQQMLLPNTLPQIPGAQISGAWQPAREVGGDYFDVIQLDDKRVGICVGDVAGKGITAALLMANLQASFRAFASPDSSPKVVCSKLNKFLCANTASGKFVTFFYAVLDEENRTLTYENAGHSPGMLLRAGGATESLRGGGSVLGVLPDWQYQDYEVQLGAGDKLVLTTDGITEAENARFEEFGEDRLLEATRAQDGSALETQRAIMQQVTAFCSGNFRDDATLLVLRLTT